MPSSFPATEPVSTIAAIRRPVWKVLHLPAADGEPAATADGASQTAAGAAAGLADAGSAAASAVEAGKAYLAAGTERLILDTAGGPFPGGTGRQIARRIAAAVAREIPIILAGGLDAGERGRMPCSTFRRSGWTWPRAWRSVPRRLRPAPHPRGLRSTATVGPRPRKDPFRVALFAKRARAARFDRPHVRPRPTPVPEALLEPDAAGRWGAEPRLRRSIRARDSRRCAGPARGRVERDPPRPAVLGRAARDAVPLRRSAHPDLPGRSARRRGPRSGSAIGRVRPPARSADLLPDRIRLYLKREDLNHTGAHKLNNALGQVLLTRRLGKSRVIAETGAGMHGVATATACALLDIPCVVHMGIEDIRRQAPNVLRMEALGAEVRPVLGGSGTLKDAVSEALRDWVTNVKTSHYCLGSTMGPHPYPMLVRDFQRVIGDEAAAQLIRGRRPAARPGNRLRRRRLERPRTAQPIHRRAECSARRSGGGRRGDRDRSSRCRPARGHARHPPRFPLVHAPGRRRPGNRGRLDLGRARLPGHRAAAGGAHGGGPASRGRRNRLGGLAAVRQVARTEGILAALESAHAVAALPEVLARWPRRGRATPATQSGQGRRSRRQFARLSAAPRGRDRPRPFRPRRQGPRRSRTQGGRIDDGADAPIDRPALMARPRQPQRARPRLPSAIGPREPTKAVPATADPTGGDGALAGTTGTADTPGARRIAAAFARAATAGRAALIPYVVAGYPDYDGSLAAALAAADAGADLLEVGLPYSDPLADGATLQRATAAALRAGATLDTSVALIRAIAGARPDVPLVPMCYANQIIGGGDGRAVAARLAEAGASGVIVADLTPDEGARFRVGRPRGRPGRRLSHRSDDNPGSPRRSRSPIGRVPLLRVARRRHRRSHLAAAIGQGSRCRRQRRLARACRGRLWREQARPRRMLVRAGADGVIVASALVDALGPEAATLPPWRASSANFGKRRSVHRPVMAHMTSAAQSRPDSIRPRHDRGRGQASRLTSLREPRR